MTKTKSTKRALVLSLLALVMCISMLVGSTYAWFTDSVTSANNKIVAGKLDIQLLMDGNLDGIYEDISESNDPIFGSETSLIAQNNNADTLWEPGKTQVAYLAIKNNGNLALKYKVALDVTNVAKDLYKVMEYAIVPNADKDNKVADWTTGNSVVPGVQTVSDEVSLPVGTTHYFALAIHMNEDAGNEYMGGQVNFDMTVLATQDTVEADSFDDQYDADLDVTNDGVSRILPDGSTVFYYNEASGYGGRVRLISLPDNLGNEYVVPAEVNDLGGVLSGKNLDKLTVPAGLKYSYKSIEGATIAELVLADGMTTVPNRLFYKANVGSVVIPDSVTTIGNNAFQQVYIDELVIPASVETFGVEAFASSSIKKITFEGKNLVFDNRPMRGCAQLETVIFNCDDVTFMNTTSNAECWIANKESNGNNYSNIKFYVKNATVAAKVREAIKHENPATTPIYVEESAFVAAKNITELNNALSSSYTDTIISLTDDINGNLTFTQNENGHLVIDGNGHEFNGTINIGAESNTTALGSITIKNINFKTTETTLNFIQSIETNHYPLNVTVSDCTFEGTGADSNVVAVSVKSAKNFTIENCTATKVHSLLQNTSGWNLTVSNSTVTNSGRGLALGTVQGVKLTEVTVDAAKYGIRIDAGYNNNAIITDCNVKAFIPVVVRKITVDSSITFNGTNTMVETNTDSYWFVAGASEYEANGALPGEVAKAVTITVNDGGLNTAGIYNNTGK